MRTKEKADPATNDGLAFFAQGPREPGTRTEIEVIGIIGFVGVAKSSEIHLSQIGCGFEVNNLRSSARCGLDLHDHVVVVAKAKIKDETLVDPPIVLNKPAKLVEVPVMRRLTVH